MDLETLGEQIREIIPGAAFEDDNDGQLIIYTNLDTDGNPLS